MLAAGSSRDSPSCCRFVCPNTSPETKNNDNTAIVRSSPQNRKQATKALTKEAKRVKTFLLQQAIRKSKAAAEKKGKKPKKAVEADGEHGEDEKQEEEEEEEAPSPADGDASGGLAASSQEVLLIKVKRRRLFRAFTAFLCWMNRRWIDATGCRGECEAR